MVDCTLGHPNRHKVSSSDLSNRQHTLHSRRWGSTSLAHRICRDSPTWCYFCTTTSSDYRTRASLDRATCISPLNAIVIVWNDSDENRTWKIIRSSASPSTHGIDVLRRSFLSIDAILECVEQLNNIWPSKTDQFSFSTSTGRSSGIPRQFRMEIDDASRVRSCPIRRTVKTPSSCPKESFGAIALAPAILTN